MRAGKERRCERFTELSPMNRGLCRAARVLPLLLVLVACISAPAPPPTKLPPTAISVPTIASTPLPTATSTALPTPEPTAPPSALIVWAAAEGPRLEALQRLFADAGRSVGVEVRVVGKSADGLLSDVRAATLADLPLPDLFWGTQDELGIFQGQDLLQPAPDDLESDVFLPATIAGAEIGEGRWGTPLAAQGALFLLYNKKLVDGPPRSSDELIVAARRQVVGDRFGLVAGWAEPRWLAAWLTGMGGAVLTAEGTPSLDTPQVLGALNLLKELRATGPPPPATYDEGVRLFRDGRAAFAIDGDWSLESYREYTDTLDLGIAPMPRIPATGRIAAPPLGGIYLMYAKTLAGERLRQAGALGAALAKPEAQARIAAELGPLPALREALDSPAVQNDAALSAAAAQAEAAPGLPPTRALRCAWGAMRADLPPVLLGEIAPEDAGRLMQASAENCLAGP
jgi:ABC-type glycerol-3-phosphate transport system substrate-binding protein